MQGGGEFSLRKFAAGVIDDSGRTRCMGGPKNARHFSGRGVQAEITASALFN